MQSMVVNLARKLRVLHKGNRRKRASEYLRQELARFANLDRRSIKISGEVNRLLLRGKLSDLRKLEISIEQKEGKNFVTLKKQQPPAPQAQQQAKAQQENKGKAEVKEGAEAQSGSKNTKEAGKEKKHQAGNKVNADATGSASVKPNANAKPENAGKARASAKLVGQGEKQPGGKEASGVESKV
ncbi:MAG: hypothetical protein ACP5IK_01225 [Candidatus Micrarchaeia archaeon]